jgi:protein-disulfide isomerase/uncharacterized membrane protein
MPEEISKETPNVVDKNAEGLGDAPRTVGPSIDARLVLRWRVAFLVLCTAGTLLSADLIRLHVRVHTDPDYHSYCAISERANCETVAASDYAVLFHLPIAVWGLLGYLFMGAMAVWGLRRPITPPSWPYGALFWLAAFSVSASAVLFYISHYIIESICVVCMGTFAVNLCLLGVATAELWRIKSRPFRALWAEIGAALAKPIAPLVLGGVFVVAPVALWLLVPPYWVIEQTMGPGGLAAGITPEGYPWIGAKKPVLTIAEFSDYQCPYCKRGHEEMRKLIETHPDKIRLVHRHYPLDNSCNEALQRPFHPYSCAYARLAVCAQKLGRFWEANDILFNNGRRREQYSVSELAAALKLRKGSLSTCERNPETAELVKKDLEAGRALQIRGTPTYVIGDRTYPGRVPSEVLDAALAR